MPEIFDTPTSRVIEGRVFPKHEKSFAQPPSELLRQVEIENAAAERAALLIPMENSIAKFNREAGEMENFASYVEPFVDSQWREIQTAENTEPLNATIKNFFWAIRNSTVGAASGVRNQYLLRVAFVPWLEVKGLSPAEKKARLENRGGVFSVPEVSISAAVKQEFPLALMTLSKFLKAYLPINGFDISPLEHLAAPDAGFEDVKPAEPEKIPTMPELMQALAAALKPKAK